MESALLLVFFFAVTRKRCRLAVLFLVSGLTLGIDGGPETSEAMPLIGVGAASGFLCGDPEAVPPRAVLFLVFGFWFLV